MHKGVKRKAVRENQIIIMGRERWRIIEDHPIYEVSDMGRIRNTISGLILTPVDDGRGYPRVKLDKRKCKVHVLVAKAYIPNPENKPIVNHKKGIKNDCRASQLEWMTVSENTKHGWVYGERKKIRKQSQKISKR